MKQDELVAVVEKLVDTCKDAENGYKNAAEHVKQEHLKNLFLELSLQRGSFVKELESELSDLGQSARENSGSVAGSARIAWMDLKANIGGGEAAVLTSVEHGEDIAKKVYVEALSNSLPHELDAVVRRQAESIMNAHETVKSMRDSLAA
jgi:uncharacterized protein (TIGR02284 family)